MGGGACVGGGEFCVAGNSVPHCVDMRCAAGLWMQDVTWHEDRWDDPESRFLAFTLHDRHATAAAAAAAACALDAANPAVIPPLTFCYP